MVIWTLGATFLLAASCSAASLDPTVVLFETKMGVLERTVENQSATISALLSATLETNKNLESIGDGIRLLQEDIRRIREDGRETRLLLEDGLRSLHEEIRRGHKENEEYSHSSPEGMQSNSQAATELTPTARGPPGRQLLSGEDVRTSRTTSVSATQVETPLLCAASVETWALNINGTNLIKYLNVEFASVKQMLDLLVGSISKTPTWAPTASPTVFPTPKPTFNPSPRPTTSPTPGPTAKFFLSSSGTWDECSSICAGLGAKLACVDDAAENSQAYFAGGNTACWLGANDRVSEGNWLCDGSSLGYSNWNTGEPNDSGGEDCVHFTTSGFWNDLSCSNAYPCLCENN